MSVTGAWHRLAGHVGRPLVQWLLGGGCLGCGEALPGGPVPLNLCGRCREALVPVSPSSSCARCARPLAGAELPAGYACGACRRRPPSFAALHVGFSYQPPLSDVVQALKFRRLDHLGDHLGTLLAERLGPRLPRLDAVVPVPLHWRRRWARGYDQAAVLARAVARGLGLPMLPLLARRRATTAQTSLSRERRLTNVRHGFRCRRSPEGRRLLLVDDVVTTGATLEAAACCLARAGAGPITALAAARTPLGSDAAHLTPGAARAYTRPYR